MSSTERPSDAQLTAAFRSQRNELSALANRINELLADRDEHDLVLATLRDALPERRAFRMIGGVLVERTVADVLPSVTAKRDGIDGAVTSLRAALESKDKAHREFCGRWNIETA